MAKVSERFDKAGSVGLQVKPQKWEWGYVDKRVSQRIYLKGTEKSDQGRECLSRAVANLSWSFCVKCKKVPSGTKWGLRKMF